MPFTYNIEIQNRIALAVWNVPCTGTGANLSAVQKVQLDATDTAYGTAPAGGAALDAHHETSQLAQWFQQTSDVVYPEPAWDRLFIAKAAMILAKTVRPDRLEQFRRDHEDALDQAIDTYTATLISSATIAGQGLTVAGIRSYVCNHCVKRKESGSNQGLRRRIFPPIADIDSHLQWVINYVWNTTCWNFRAREVTVVLTPLAVTGATWTESTKTITKTNGFIITLTAGQPLFVTGGTAATTGVYTVVSQTSDDSCILVSSIGATDGATDIAFTTYAVTMRGLASGESFDSIASNRFYFDGNNGGMQLDWVDKDRAPALRAYHGSTTGVPCYFRTQPVGASKIWHLYPIPDTTYTLFGTVYASTPSMSDLAAINTAITMFPAEFGTVIRDMVLARVLLQHNASDAERMWTRCTEQVESFGAAYTDAGMPAKMTSVGDVYNDHSALIEGGGFQFGF